jgi:hypothetical protein
MMGLRLKHGLEGELGGKVGGSLRFKDHDVAVDDLHFVGADRQLGRGCIQGSGAEVDPRGLKRAPTQQSST